MPDTYEKKSISEELARKMMRAAHAEANKLGIPMTIAVCDESGILKAFLRMDGAALLSVDVAINKAKTAAGFGISTDAWYDFIKDDPPLSLGAPHIKDLVIFGGGYPIKVDDQVIGAIGVSGGHYNDDMKCAKAALAVLE